MFNIRSATYEDASEAVRQQFSSEREFFLNYKPSCPQCATPMTNMGNAFKPPRQNQSKAWRAVEEAAKNGERFWAVPSWL